MKIRLLVCHDCRSIEELPDFKGNPRDDHLLEHLSSKHRFPNGEEHVGALCDVEKDQWENDAVRQEIVAHIGKPSDHTGLEPEYYATKNTFQADALACYSQHNRPKQGCIDWKDDRKRLGNPSQDPRAPKVYLCDFCPVKTYVVTEQRHRAGLYKD